MADIQAGMPNVLEIPSNLLRRPEFSEFLGYKIPDPVITYKLLFSLTAPAVQFLSVQMKIPGAERIVIGEVIALQFPIDGRTVAAQKCGNLVNGLLSLPPEVNFTPF